MGKRRKSVHNLYVRDILSLSKVLSLRWHPLTLSLPLFELSLSLSLLGELPSDDHAAKTTVARFVGRCEKTRFEAVCHVPSTPRPSQREVTRGSEVPCHYGVDHWSDKCLVGGKFKLRRLSSSRTDEGREEKSVYFSHCSQTSFHCLSAK